MLGSLSMGGTAAVGTTYNFCGKLNNRLFEAYQRKDLEAALLEQVCAYCFDSSISVMCLMLSFRDALKLQ